MKLLLFICLCIPLRAQISLEASPESMASTNDIPLKVIGLWDIRICNDSRDTRELVPERIYMAPWVAKETGKPVALPWMTAAHAARVWQVRAARNPAQIAVELLGYGADITLAMMGWDVISASKKAIGSLAAGRGIASIVQSRLQKQVPSITIFTDEMLTGPVLLPPMGCTTRTAFSAKLPKAKVIVLKAALP